MSSQPFNFNATSLQNSGMTKNVPIPKFIGKDEQEAIANAEIFKQKTTKIEETGKWTSNLGMDGDWFTADNAEEREQGRGSLAKIFRPTSDIKGRVNIVNNFPWTISDVKNRTDIPYIQLSEQKVLGGQIQKQVAFYTQGVSDTAADVFASEDRPILDVYKEIFPREPTGFTYKFPYFAKAYYELTTSQWEQFDKISSSGGSIASGLKTLFGSKTADAFSGAASFFSSAANTALAAKYPVVGVADRPRIFTGHNDRTMTIEFPLYNTLEPKSWIKNKDFLHVFMSQNLFNKRNFITGLPPVWYQVWVPGQYFSVASCVTNITVTNLGNIRMEEYRGKEFVVPDAYQITIQLTELAMPSKNQFQAAVDGTAEMRVNSKEVFTKDNTDIPIKADEPKSSYPPLNVPVKTEGTITNSFRPYN